MFLPCPVRLLGLGFLDCSSVAEHWAFWLAVVGNKRPSAPRKNTRNVHLKFEAASVRTSAQLAASAVQAVRKRLLAADNSRRQADRRRRQREGTPTK
jgi:hypothetical protein